MPDCVSVRRKVTDIWKGTCQAAALALFGHRCWLVTALLQAGGSRGKPAEGAAGSGQELDSWFLDGVDLLLQHSPDQGERAAEAIQDQLTQIDA